MSAAGKIGLQVVAKEGNDDLGEFFDLLDNRFEEL